MSNPNQLNSGVHNTDIAQKTASLRTPNPKKNGTKPKSRFSPDRNLAEQMIFVILAFATMVLVSYLFVSRIINEKMDEHSRANFANTYHHVGAIFNNLEMITLNLAYAIEEAVDEGQPIEEIQESIKAATTYHRLVTSQNQITAVRRIFRPDRFYAHLEYNGPNCVIDEQYFHGGGWIPPDGYDYQERQWFREIIESDGELMYTNPYKSLRTHDFSFGLGMKLFGGETREYQPFGVLQVNVEVNQLMNIITSLQQTKRGYAVLVNPNGLVVGHFNPNEIGRHLSDTSLGGKHIIDSFGNISTDFTEPTRFYSRNADGVWCVFDCGVLHNGWLVASVVPVYEYRSQERLVGLILSIIGTIMAGTLCFFLARLSHEKEQADIKNQSKSLFLAKMSHEIRTPMNAIAGLAQLIVRDRKTLPPKIVKYSVEIRQAADNLLAIINDVLDISKIEAGRMEIVKVPFALSSLLDDVIRVTHNRAYEKGLQFISFVDAKLPNNLYGDIVHIRQVLLNILGNAAKYTREGYIAFDVFGAGTEDNVVTISFVIRDTGIGIKQEDQPKIFSEYAQVGTEHNWGIEGTGLGLAICKELVENLGGVISVVSQQGIGSTFKVNFPIQMQDDEPSAIVNNPQDHCVLLYEPRSIYEQSLIRALSHLGVPYMRVQSISSFNEVLQNSPKISLIFIASFVFDEVSRFMGQIEVSMHNLVLLCEGPDQSLMSTIRSAMLPINALHVAGFLNDTHGDPGTESGIRTFTRMSDARILVVDDNQPNLLVAEGLLAPYKCHVDFASSGKEALQYIKQLQYDLILMDHMMPEMDGIETTRHIRNLHQATGEHDYTETVPIIAFTANAIFGMKEVFLKNGMNDLLTKPIDPARLHEVMLGWIPPEKHSDEAGMESSVLAPSAESIQIPGINTKVGIIQTGGTVNGYIRVLSALPNELESKLKTMRDALENDDFAAYRMCAHTYKGFLATVGALTLSTTAAILESAAHDNNRSVINTHHDKFIEELKELSSTVTTSLGERREKTGNKPVSLAENDRLHTQLQELKSAITEKKMQRIDAVIDELLAKDWDKETAEQLERIAQCITLFEWTDASALLDLLLER